MTTQERRRAAARLERLRDAGAPAEFASQQSAPDDSASPARAVALAARALEEALSSGESVDPCAEALTDALYDVS